MMTWKKRQMACLAMLGVVSFVGAANADVALAPGSSVVNGPAISGTDYTHTLPAWATGTAVDTLVAPMTIDFSGSCTSKVFYLNGVDASGGLGFTYQFSVTAPPNLRAATMNPTGWTGVAITDAGSDGSGSSTAAAGAPTWTDGDAHTIGRNELASDGDEAPNVNFRVGSVGTQIATGNTSAIIFFATDATDYQRSSWGLLDSGKIGRVATFAPIPEPAAAILGLIGLAPMMLRRRNNA